MKKECKQYVFSTTHNTDNPYTIVSNSLVDDPNLTPDALFIMLQILRGYNNHRFYVEVFSIKHDIDKRRVQKAIKLLIELGYCKKIKHNSRVIDYFFHECPLNSSGNIVPLIISEEQNSSGNNVPQVRADLYLSSGENVPLIITNNINNIESKGDSEKEEQEFHIKYCDEDLPNKLIEIESNQNNFEENKGLRLNLFTNELYAPPTKKIKSNSNKCDFDAKDDLKIIENKSEAPLSSKIELESSRLKCNNTNKKYIPMEKTFTLKRRDLIYQAFNSFEEFTNLERKDYYFDKWYNYKMGVDSPERVQNLKQYWNGFNSFVQKDKSLGFKPIEKAVSVKLENVIERKKTIEEIKADRDRIENILEKITLQVYTNLKSHWEANERIHTDLLNYIKAYNKDLTPDQINAPNSVITGLTNYLMLADWSEIKSYLIAKGYKVLTGVLIFKPEPKSKLL